MNSLGQHLHDPSPSDIARGDAYPRGINSPLESMAFIANARQDVPWLLDLVAVLTKAPDDTRNAL